MAVQHAHGALAAELLEFGASPDAATGRGFTPLMLACLYNQQDLVMNLLDRGVKVSRTYVDTYAKLPFYFTSVICLSCPNFICSGNSFHKTIFPPSSTVTLMTKRIGTTYFYTPRTQKPIWLREVK